MIAASTLILETVRTTSTRLLAGVADLELGGRRQVTCPLMLLLFLRRQLQLVMVSRSFGYALFSGDDQG